MSPSQEPLFARGAAIRSVFGHPAVLLGGGRALMLQLAHPAVARGVAEHSDFAYQTAATLREVHARVTGPGYAATDPELVLWVHATLVDTALEMHARWVRPLPGPVADAFYAESMVLGELLGAPVAHQPPDLPAFADYMHETIETVVPEIGEQQRRLARAVLHPRVPTLADPLVVLARQLTVGLLPEPVRRAFGLGWDLPREAALRTTTLGTRLAAAQLRLARRAVPSRLVAA